MEKLDKLFQTVKRNEDDVNEVKQYLDSLDQKDRLKTFLSIIDDFEKYQFMIGEDRTVGADMLLENYEKELRALRKANRADIDPNNTDEVIGETINQLS